jgi:hypothetical protein
MPGHIIARNPYGLYNKTPMTLPNILKGQGLFKGDHLKG